MKLIRVLNISTLIALWLVFTGCGSSEKLNQANLAHLYQQEGVVLKPMFYVYHLDENMSRLYFQASSDQLLYKKDDTQDNKYIARYQASYILYNSFEEGNVLDSGSTVYSDERGDLETTLLKGSIDFNSSINVNGGEYVLKILLKDINRKLTYENYIFIHRKDPQHRQNFILKNQQGRILFMNKMSLNESFILENNAGVKQYSVRYYNRQFPLATPPYVDNRDLQFDYAADSVYSVNASDTLQVNKKGFYHFQFDESTKEGFTLFVFDDEFPFITKKSQMAPPLRYLTTSEEFTEVTTIDEIEEQKYEVDKFWLKSAGSIERGKHLIRNYYGRVEDANIFFTSYLEGWKTDRGIVYTILGPPSRVVRRTNMETWIYGNENSTLEMVFTFVKVYNPFSDNDYSLARMNKYRYVWGQAIDAWRHGTAYGIKEIIREQDERDQQLRTSNPPYFWY